MRAGEAVQLQCLAHGTPPLTFQWSRVGGSLSRRVTARNEVLHFESVAPEDSGRYRCQVTNKVGSAEAFTLLLVQGEQPRSGWAEWVSFPPGPFLTQQLAPRDPHLGHKDLPPLPHLGIPPFPCPPKLEDPITEFSAPPALMAASLRWHCPRTAKGCLHKSSRLRLPDWGRSGQGLGSVISAAPGLSASGPRTGSVSAGLADCDRAAPTSGVPRVPVDLQRIQSP